MAEEGARMTADDSAARFGWYLGGVWTGWMLQRDGFGWPILLLFIAVGWTCIFYLEPWMRRRHAR